MPEIQPRRGHNWRALTIPEMAARRVPSATRRLAKRSEPHQPDPRAERATLGWRLRVSENILSFPVVAAAVLSSCATADRFAQHSVEYNLQAETIKNQNLLNNIIRSAYRRPLQFTDLTTITGQVSVSGTGGFTVPFGGPRSGFIFSPSVTASETPNFTVAVLNTQEFYKGILTPITTQILAYYISQGFPRELLLRLLISEIKEENGRSLYNAPGSRHYDIFVSELESLIFDRGLTVQPVLQIRAVGPPLSDKDAKDIKDIAKLDAQQIELVRHDVSEEHDGLSAAQKAMLRRDRIYYQLEKRNVSYRFCLDTEPETSKGPSTCPTREEERRIENPLAKRQMAGIHALEIDGREISLKVRSVEGVIYYLGEIARLDLGLLDGNRVYPPTIRGEHYCGGKNILFHLETGSGQDQSISTSYGGSEYHVNVDPRGCDRSAQVMELVMELLALNNSAKDLPAPSVIPVITR